MDETHSKERSSSQLFNLPTKTVGGTQLWTDHLNRNGFRIQQHALTGHWRLLDPKDVRRAWGTRGQVESALEKAQPQIEVPPAGEHVVVLLHGLMRSHHSMKPVETELTKHGFDRCIRFSYASTRCAIADHAQALRELLEDLPPNSRLSFVGHSMGNIVVRHLVGDLQREGDPTKLLGRCRSMVMLGPPNQGAAIARRLAPTGLYGIVTGKSGLELGPEWQEFVQHLATPPFPFMVIAGDLSNIRIQNPLVDGSSDFVVSVEESMLEGAKSHQTVPVLHSFLMNDQATRELAVQFIESHTPAEPSGSPPLQRGAEN